MFEATTYTECTNLERQVTVKTQFFMVAADIYGGA
jgi:hypothetical protein